jgi:hypothetical protein
MARHPRVSLCSALTPARDDQQAAWPAAQRTVPAIGQCGSEDPLCRWGGDPALHAASRSLLHSRTSSSLDDVDVTSETAALGQVRPRARTRGSLMVRNDVPPVSLGLSQSTRGLTRYRHRVGCPRWPSELRLVMALWRRCATGKTPSHRLVGPAGPSESRRQATGSRSLTIRRLRVRACRRSNAASTSVDGGSLDQRLPTCRTSPAACSTWSLRSVLSWLSPAALAICPTECGSRGSSRSAVLSRSSRGAGRGSGAATFGWETGAAAAL